MRHKLVYGGKLVGTLVRANARAAARAFLRGPAAGLRASVQALRRLSRGFKMMYRLKGRARTAHTVHLCLESGAGREELWRNPEAAFVLAEELNGRQQYDEAITRLNPLLTDSPEAAKLYGIRGMAYLGLGRYAEALDDFSTCDRLRPQAARDFTYNLFRSYVAGIRGDTETARRAMAAQMVPGHGGTPEEALASFLHARVADALAPLNLRGTVGVIIGCFSNAVGHAILDPFHFIQLFRHRFDHLVLLHPPYGQYTPATRLAAQILDQYVEQVEVTDSDVLNFAWQTLGELRHEQFTFLVHTYWSLNRMAYRARLGGTHPMAHGRDYLQLPPKLVARAEAVCRRNHLDLSRPIVVVHTREHGYHGLRGQRYRNTDVNNYIPALRRLVALGYQVVRIGDKKMYSVRREVPGLLELPATDYYDPVLDPYFISRCKFMISCQSGPCSYARVFGKPNLVVNAVYHYTLLPENNELLAFKSYHEVKTRRPLGVEELFRAGVHLFDRTDHFDAAGIEVEDMTPDEILAATEEMVGWLEKPDRPETASQRAFRQMMERFAANSDRSHRLAHPMTDYIGYALPECRISDAVCQLRPGYLPADAAAPAAVPRIKVA